MARSEDMEAQFKQSVFAMTASRCLALQTVLDLRLLSKECVAEAAAEAERQRGHGESIFSLDLLSVRGEPGPSSSAQAACLFTCGHALRVRLASYAILPQLALRCVLHVLRIAGACSGGVSAALWLLTLAVCAVHCVSPDLLPC